MQLGGILRECNPQWLPGPLSVRFETCRVVISPRLPHLEVPLAGRTEQQHRVHDAQDFVAPRTMLLQAGCLYHADDESDGAGSEADRTQDLAKRVPLSFCHLTPPATIRQTAISRFGIRKWSEDSLDESSRQPTRLRCELG